MKLIPTQRTFCQTQILYDIVLSVSCFVWEWLNFARAFEILQPPQKRLWATMFLFGTPWVVKHPHTRTRHAHARLTSAQQVADAFEW